MSTKTSEKKTVSKKTSTKENVSSVVKPGKSTRVKCATMQKEAQKTSPIQQTLPSVTVDSEKPKYKCIGGVQTTWDYDKFRLMESNREVRESNILRMAEIIEEMGFFDFNPILVNKNGVIIDGQHRFLALVLLEWEIVFQVIDVEDEDAEHLMLDLNRNNTNWVLDNYIKSYSDRKIPCYEETVDLSEKYGISIANSLVICVGKPHTVNINIRECDLFQVSKNKEDVAKFIKQCKTRISYWGKRSFVYAIVDVLPKLGKDDRKKLLDNIHKVEKQSKTSEYISSFVNVVNSVVSENNEL